MESPSWPEILPSNRIKAIQELTQGQNLTNKLREMLGQPGKIEADLMLVDGVVGEILGMFDNTLSILSSSSSGETNSHIPTLGTTSPNSWDEVKSENSCESIKTSTLPVKSRRGCYKRRKNSSTYTKVTSTLIDDGYAWRKYGQKVILNSKHHSSFTALPPPPPMNWDSQSPKTPPPMSRPPVLVTPTRPIPLINEQPLVSPIEPLPESEENLETPKPKLKPLHWDKVRASSDREMVWDQLKSSSFKLNEEMIETLFIVKTPNSANSNETSTTRRPILPSPTSHENRVLDPKKSQNIAILLRALNVTVEEVCDALLEGNADTLGTELLESLLKMAPTKEEERKLIEYKDDTSVKLGPAEKFLKAVLDVPFAFKRVDAMLYVSNFESEIEYLKRSFQTLEVACEELRNSRMFLKLLEAVLKTGNRMNVGTNRGDAHAFKLDTLLKLIDVKGTDGKTTLLHFVVQEITKSEGARLTTTHETNPDTQNSPVNNETKCRKLGLQVVASISSELSNVKKAASMDSEVLNGDVTRLSKGISDILQVVRLNENQTRFSESMNKFMRSAEEEIIRIQAQESVALSLVKEITEYFHGNSAKEEAHPFRIFLVVRDFLNVLDRVCKEVGSINERIVISSAHKFPVPVNPTLPPVFTGFPIKRQYSSSDDESNSSSSFQMS